MITETNKEKGSTKYRKIFINLRMSDKVCIKFIEMQGNYANAIRYLIMKEVKENGFRNLNSILPAELTDSYFNFNFSNIMPELIVSGEGDMDIDKREENKDKLNHSTFYESSHANNANNVNNGAAITNEDYDDDFDIFDDEGAEVIRGVMINADKV